jgi:hypothetical protein
VDNGGSIGPIRLIGLRLITPVHQCNALYFLI